MSTNGGAQPFIGHRPPGGAGLRAVLVIVGMALACGAVFFCLSPAAYARSATALSKSVHDAAVSPTTSAQPDYRSLAAQYLAIARAGNRHLEKDFDGLEKEDRRDLKASDAYLRDAAATEHRFDRRLAAIRFPGPMGAVAKALFRVNEVRAGLTERASRSRSLPELRRWEPQLTVANAPVEQQVRAIRKLLGLPPPSSS